MEKHLKFIKDIRKSIPVFLNNIIDRLRKYFDSDKIALLLRDKATGLVKAEIKNGKFPDLKFHYTPGKFHNNLKEVLDEEYISLPLFMEEFLGSIVIVEPKNKRKNIDKAIKLVRFLSLLIALFNAKLEQSKLQVRVKTFLSKDDSFNFQKIDEVLKFLQLLLEAELVGIFRKENDEWKLSEFVSTSDEFALYSLNKDLAGQVTSEGILTYCENFNSVIAFLIDEDQILFIGTIRSYAYNLTDLMTAKIVFSQFLAMTKFESKLEKFYTYLTAAWDSVPEGIIVVDENKQLIYINRIAKNYIPQLSVVDSIEHLKYNPIISTILMVLDTAIPIVNSEISVGGRIFRVNSFSIMNENLNTKAAVLFFKDITVEKKKEERLKRLEHLSILGEFAAGVAHEIKNPLGGMRMLAQVSKEMLEVRDEENINEVKENLDYIMREVDRLTDIVNNIRTLAKPEIGILEDVKVSDLIKDVEKLLINRLQKLGIDYDLEIEYDALLKVNKAKFKQVLLNILENAVQAMENSDNKKLKIKVFKDENVIKISISDTGCGISPQEIDKIFNPFYTTKETGTGLGLSIANRIIEEFAGWIEVSSSIGKGSCFTICFPSILKDY